MMNFNGDWIQVEGGLTLPEGEEPLILKRIVWPGYFETMGIKLTAGRTFTDKDNLPDGIKSVIINESLARYYWPNDNPVGKRLRFTRFKNTWLEVIGVASNTKHNGLDQSTPMGLYLPLARAMWGGRNTLNAVVRTTQNPQDLVNAVRQIIKQADPALPIYGVTTIDKEITQHWRLRIRHMYSWLFGIFATVAGFLAIAGIYGVVAYSVCQRTQEFGIRKALGAQYSQIINMIIKKGLVLSIIGSGIGIISALGLTHFLSGYLYGISPTDPLTFTLVPLMLIAVTMLACWLPARRAAKVDPMEALRYE
jgi:predicted permease